MVSYVYGAVHHLDSWVKRKPTWCHLFYYFIQCSFNAQQVSVVLTAETCWALNEHWIK